MTKKSRKTLAAIVIGIVLLLLVLKKPAAPSYAPFTYATTMPRRTSTPTQKGISTLGSSTIIPEPLVDLPTPTTEPTLASSTIVPEELKELPTPTTQPTLGSSTIVAKDETGLPMPQNKVPANSIAKGWGSTYDATGIRFIMYLQDGQRVEILERKGLDIRIRAQGKTGWVRGWFVQKYRAECLRDYK